MLTQILNNGTQIINTEIGDTGTQILSSGTQIIGNAPTLNTENFIGGLLQKGETINGWTLIEKINIQSGEADLYIASKNNQKGVIKYYRGNIHPKTDLLEKLIELNHPDIINIFEFGEYKKHFYEIMEYAAGGALDTKTEDGTYKYLPVSEEKAIQICREVINSYKTCHEKGIIHRDIKPANIYFRNADGTDVVIGDFGISSIINEDEIITHKTTTASRTTGYAAPEVLSGIISPKMDYYALGITLWEILTGKDPFVLENGKRRNDAHLIRDTIEGRIVDDILSRDPQISDSMQHLIRGLLVIDEEKRWGYDEVTRHLNGEYIVVPSKEVKAWDFKLADKNCTSLEELGTALAENVDSDSVQKTVYRGFLSSFLEDKYPEVAKQISEITEKYSADGNLKGGIQKLVWLLNPNAPYITKNGYKAENLDDIENFLLNAPEEMIIELQDENTGFYSYLKHLGYEDKINTISALAENLNLMTDFEKLNCLCEMVLVLKDYVITPFSSGKYKDFKLSDIFQLENLPSDLGEYVANLISQKSLQGLFYTWFFKKIEFCLFTSVKNYSDLKKIISAHKIWFMNNKTRTKDLSEEQEESLFEAERLFYEECKSSAALKLVEELYHYDEKNQQVLYLFLCILNRDNSTRISQVVSSINYDSLGLALFEIDNKIRNRDFAQAKEIVKNTMEKWSDVFLLKCQAVKINLAEYKKTSEKYLLDNSESILKSLGNAKTRLELTKQVKLLNTLNMLRGNESIDFSDRRLCDKFSLYYDFLQ